MNTSFAYNICNAITVDIPAAVNMRKHQTETGHAPTKYLSCLLLQSTCVITQSACDKALKLRSWHYCVIILT